MVALAGLVDAGFSGDWQARGYLSDAAADTARTACLTAAAAHVVLTGAAGFIAKAKGEGIGAAMITLAVRIVVGRVDAGVVAAVRAGSGVLGYGFLR